MPTRRHLVRPVEEQKHHNVERNYSWLMVRISAQSGQQGNGWNKEGCTDATTWRAINYTSHELCVLGGDDLQVKALHDQLTDMSSGKSKQE